MFGEYFGKYLFDRGIISETVRNEMSDCSYPMLSARFEGNLRESIDAFKTDEQLTDDAFEALKGGVIDEIIEKLVLSEKLDEYTYNRFAKMVLKYIYVYISQNLVIKPVKRITEYQHGIINYLKMTGDQSFSLALAGEGGTEIAAGFVKKAYPELDDEALAAVNEFLNCVCGLFVTELSHLNVDVDVEIPITQRDKQLQTIGVIYRIPLIINGKELDLLMTEDGKEEFL